jgi:hypothetical protein
MVVKQLGSPFNLFEDKRYDKLMARKNKALIGHNRYATIGGVSRASAHPFENDTLIGVHNGTLQNHHRFEDALDFHVDSEKLYHHIHKRGVRDALRHAEGAWALVWWDKKEESLNFLRNAERPLWMCRSEDLKTLFWASEAWMLDIALSRHSIKHGDLFQLTEDKLHTLQIDRNSKMSAPIIIDAKGVEKPVYQPYNSNFTVKPHTISTQITGTNVVVPLKKKGGLDTKFASRTYVELETMGRMLDSFSAPYIACFDKGHPDYEIRLYVQQLKTQILEDEGQIAGSISGFVSNPRTPGTGYYKVAPLSVVCRDEEDPVGADDVLYMNHAGRLVNKEDWKHQYKACGWCSLDLDPEEENQFTTSGDCICASCKTLDDVKMYTNFI